MSLTVNFEPEQVRIRIDAPELHPVHSLLGLVWGEDDRIVREMSLACAQDGEWQDDALDRPTVECAGLCLDRGGRRDLGLPFLIAAQEWLSYDERVSSDHNAVVAAKLRDELERIGTPA